MIFDNMNVEINSVEFPGKGMKNNFTGTSTEITELYDRFLQCSGYMTKIDHETFTTSFPIFQSDVSHQKPEL